MNDVKCSSGSAGVRNDCGSKAGDLLGKEFFVVESEMGRAFIRSYRQFHKLRSNMDIVPGLKQSEFMVMGTAARIRCNDPEKQIRVSDLIRLTRMPAPGLSRTLRNVEKKGYLKRTQDPADRRNTLVVFTPKGVKLWKAAAHVMEMFYQEMLARYGENRMQELIDLQNELYNTAVDILKDKRMFQEEFLRMIGENTPEDTDSHSGSDAEEE